MDQCKEGASLLSHLANSSRESCSRVDVAGLCKYKETSFLQVRHALFYQMQAYQIQIQTHQMQTPVTAAVSEIQVDLTVIFAVCKRAVRLTAASRALGVVRGAMAS
jgi:hypothetical protein